MKRCEANELISAAVAASAVPIPVQVHWGAVPSHLQVQCTAESHAETVDVFPKRCAAHGLIGIVQAFLQATKSCQALSPDLDVLLRLC